MNSITLILLYVGWSVASLVVNGNIFSGIRNFLLVKIPFLGNLISCVQCLSFWIGAVFVFLFHKGILPFYFPKEIPLMYGYIFYPFIQSSFSVIMESFLFLLVKRK